MTRYSDILSINELELNVRLGEFSEERVNTQRVALTCKFFYQNSPNVAAEDNGTFLCYDKLSRHLHNVVSNGEFRFIEHLVHALFKEIQIHINAVLGEEQHPYVWIKLDKLDIPVTYTIRSASFVHTNLPEGVLIHG